VGAWRRGVQQHAGVGQHFIGADIAEKVITFNQVVVAQEVIAIEGCAEDRTVENQRIADHPRGDDGGSSQHQQRPAAQRQAEAPAEGEVEPRQDKDRPIEQGRAGQ